MAKHTFPDNNPPAPPTTGHRHIRGTLGADRFTVRRDEVCTVISGGGNVEYGRGKFDCLDLSDRSINAVKAWSPAECKGELYNTGNGDRVFDALSLDDGSRILFEGLDIVEFSDAVLMLSNDPNDPKFGEQWNLHMMGVHNAWRFTQGSNRILVGIQDTGLGYCNSRHRFHSNLALSKTLCLQDNIQDDYYREFPGDCHPEPNSHGTPVQSIISAGSNNHRGICGINWHSQTFHIDVLDSNSGDLSLVQATQKMIQQADSRGQRLIVNLSAENFPPCSEFEDLVRSYQDEALFVFAAGNDGKSKISHPASLCMCHDNVISVGASWGTPDYAGKGYSLGDRFPYSNYGEGLSLMGPSGVLAAAANQHSPESVAFGWHQQFHGTSAATPHVAGVASLVWSINPQLTAGQVHKLMTETACDIGPVGYDLYNGYGFVDADAAVRRAMAMAVSRAGIDVLPSYEIHDSAGVYPAGRKQWLSKRMLTSSDLSLMISRIVLASELSA